MTGEHSLVPVVVVLTMTRRYNNWKILFQEAADCIDWTIGCWCQYRERTVFQICHFDVCFRLLPLGLHDSVLNDYYNAWRTLRHFLIAADNDDDAEMRIWNADFAGQCPWRLSQARMKLLIRTLP